MILDYFRLAWTSISHRKVRSYLTIIGIFIGIAAVVSLIALGQGLDAAIDEQFALIGVDKLIITPKSELGFGQGASVKLTEDDLRAIDRVLGVRQVGGVYYKTGTLEFDGESTIYYIYGLPTDESRDMIAEAFDIEVLEGRMLRDDELFKVALASDYLNKPIFDTTPLPGKTVQINGKDFEVVGIVKTSDSAGGEDRGIIINEEAFREVTGDDAIGQVWAQVYDPQEIEKVADDVTRALRRHRGVDAGEEDFDVQTPLQLLEGFNAIFNIVQTVLIGIAAISLLVGAVGIMNTMYTSVAERTKEIGIMKAIGATNEQVRNLFLIESGILGLFGGAVGVLVGVGIGKLVELIAQASLGVTLIRAEFPPALVAGALTFAFVLGAVSGMLPAIQASKMKPVDAIRSK